MVRCLSIGDYGSGLVIGISLRVTAQKDTLIDLDGISVVPKAHHTSRRNLIVSGVVYNSSMLCVSSDPLAKVVLGGLQTE